ncbi:glycosyltransferase family 4 protein [Paenibacillus flagellatus]|uniref:Glycosyl transferase family 1 n=1 Tax=Paenibacillus flagellatus TaxID=2211139 RepID=A0A2V5K677_9BACL|nr:glycosyltransferase family 4 protein [Paenibacillus flagellatus]PYI54292.1 glycosyl transferase family 1 [Paenibacillus flagellatus]
MTKIGYVSTYVPQKCGLATYTHHLRQAVHGAKEWRPKDPVVVLTGSDADKGNDPLLWPLPRDREEAYARMARRINQSDIDVVSLQHEFGIFGGDAGAHVLTFVRSLNKPLITTFHTVFEKPPEPYASIQREIAEKSFRIVVMNRKAIDYLHQSFGIPKEKLIFIPHGTPAPDAESRHRVRERLGWGNRKVLMTFGLLSRGKGIELLLNILPDIAKKVPDVLYAIVGQTHPEVKKREGERYREELRKRIESSGMERHTVMLDRYMEESDLVKHMMACDLYVTPYPGMEQITSGTLAYAVGLGRPVLTTPYAYAQDLLADYPELLLPYDSPAAWTDAIVSLLTNDVRLKSWSKKIESLGSGMHWPEVGRRHQQLFAEVTTVESLTR